MTNTAYGVARSPLVSINLSHRTLKPLHLLNIYFVFYISFPVLLGYFF